MPGIPLPLLFAIIRACSPYSLRLPLLLPHTFNNLQYYQQHLFITYYAQLTTHYYCPPIPSLLLYNTTLLSPLLLLLLLFHYRHYYHHLSPWRPLSPFIHCLPLFITIIQPLLPSSLHLFITTIIIAFHYQSLSTIPLAIIIAIITFFLYHTTMLFIIHYSLLLPRTIYLHAPPIFHARRDAATPDAMPPDAPYATTITRHAILFIHLR